MTPLPRRLGHHPHFDSTCKSKHSGSRDSVKPRRFMGIQACNASSLSLCPDCWCSGPLGAKLGSSAPLKQTPSTEAVLPNLSNQPLGQGTDPAAGLDSNQFCTTDYLAVPCNGNMCLLTNLLTNLLVSRCHIASERQESLGRQVLLAQARVTPAACLLVSCKEQ